MSISMAVSLQRTFIAKVLARRLTRRGRHWELAVGISCLVFDLEINSELVRPSMLRDEDAARAGLTKDHAHRNPKYGGGYPVFVEGFHQLHCLVGYQSSLIGTGTNSSQNLVRKSLYYNYDYYSAEGKEAFQDSEKVLRWHVCQ